MLPLELSWPEAYGILRPLAIFVAGMAMYAIFIFKFYRFLARKDIFHLNLEQYNTATYPFLKKFFSSIFFVIEFIVLFPVFVTFWFSILTVLLAFLSEDRTIQTIMLVSVAVVSTVRVTAYYDEDLSRDLAKMLPFALLGIFLVNISYFSFSDSVEALKQIPLLWKNLIYYALFAISLEVLLRILHSFYTVFRPQER